MERFTISMNSSDIDLFERKRADVGMSKSAFIRLLIAEHENKVPTFIQHKELIKALSEINTSLKELLISDNIEDVEKIIIYEKIDNTNKLVEELLRK